MRKGFEDFEDYEDLLKPTHSAPRPSRRPVGRKKKGVVLTSAEQEQLLALIKAQGFAALEKLFGISESAIARAATGGRVLAGTQMLIRIGLGLERTPHGGRS